MASEWKRDYRMGNPTLALTRRRTNRHILYRVLFLTVPPNFQYQNEKRWAANQRFSSMIFLMYKRSSLVEQRFLFSPRAT